MFEKIPAPLTSLFPKRIWRGPNDGKKIYLTFDDGPIPEITPWTLETLRIFNAKATFFCIGDNVQKYPDTFKKVISEGHTIGNHTHNHLNGWKTSSEKYIENVLLAEKNIKEKRGERRENRERDREYRKFDFQNLSGGPRANFDTKTSEANSKQQTTSPFLFRPPYGRITGIQAQRLQQKNYNIVMWDVLSKDYNATISSEKCFRNVVKNAIPGSIIVFHDSLKAEKNLKTTLPKVLEYYAKAGFTFEKL